MAMLREHRIELDGARAVVVGRSDIVGKPMAHLLDAGERDRDDLPLAHDATSRGTRSTPTCSSPRWAFRRWSRPDMVKPGGVVIDVGINRTDAGLVGDVDPGAAEVAAFMTPVPGGVGPMTIACLLENAVRCARYRRGELAYPARAIRANVARAPSVRRTCSHPARSSRSG